MYLSKIKLALLSSLAGGAIFAISPELQAQPSDLMLDPGGTTPAPEPGPSAPPVANTGSAEGGEIENVYFGDYVDGEIDRDDGWEGSEGYSGGIVPPTHTVRRGDTLWDISAFYFNNAWNWPKVWALNPEITNPHWIYPGNLVRLRNGSVQLPAQQQQGGETGEPLINAGRVIGLKQMAYVDSDELEDAGRIDGSIDEKSLLAMGDSVYISYPEGKLPKIGETFSVYTEGKEVKRDKKVAGRYVEVTGELRITFAKEGKRARAVLTRSVEPVERGMRVGPLKLNFSDVKPVANDTKVDGHVVDVIGPDDLIGAEAAVIIDRGSNDGVKVGNRFLVIRRGDAYKTVMRPSSNVGQDDDEYPARAIGEIIVLQTGDAVSMGVVTFSIHEFGVGDRVFMRQGQ